MSAIGITHLFVDHVNGFPVASLAILEPPVFENAAFKIYALPPKSPARRVSAIALLEDIPNRAGEGANCLGLIVRFEIEPRPGCPDGCGAKFLARLSTLQRDDAVKM
jgi:hypothetical protein